MNIAILGSHPATKMQAPFDDPDWQIWACSPHNAEPRGDSGALKSATPLPRVDQWFETHLPALDATRPAEYLDYVRELSERIPVWMRDRSQHIKALRYPDEDMEREFGPFFRTSSIAMMQAKAIAERPDAIGLWGIMQSAPNEYTYQKPTIQHLLWEASRRGIRVVLPDESGLLRRPNEDW